MQDVIVGFSCLGVRRTDGLSEGEVGFVHIAPAVRGKGLGKLMYILSHIQLIEGGVDRLRVVIGDKTGAVQSWVNQTGYTYSHTDPELSHSPIWQMDVLQRKEVLAELKDKFHVHIGATHPQDLIVEPFTVDYDNPKRVSIFDVAVSNLARGGTRLFGYPTAPVFIWENEYEGTIVMEVENKPPKESKAFLVARENPHSPYRLQSLPLCTVEDKIEWIHFFANIARKTIA